MTLNVMREGTTAQISENGHNSEWGLRIEDEQLDYVIERLQQVKHEIYLVNNTGTTIPLISSNLLSVFYNGSNETMIIEFKGGNKYEYHKVPLSVYLDLLKAKSHGIYFHKNIKDEYKCMKIEIL